jgi:phage tail-like protein
MNALPSYRQYLLLAPGPGWRSTTVGLTEDPTTGAYSLDALPGSPVAWPPIPGAAPVSPVAFATGKDGFIVVLDGTDMRIKAVDPAGKAPARELPAVGGLGRDARHFRAAEDVAVLDDGFVAVADSGNAEVKIFSPYPHALVAVWGGFGRPTRIAEGAGGLLWVIDCARRRVVGLDRNGDVRQQLPGLTDPLALAVDASGNVAVLDGANLLLFPASGAGTPVSIGAAPGGSCLVFGQDGILHVGAGGLIYGFAPDGQGGWQAAGIGVVGQQATIKRLLWLGGATMLAVVQASGAKVTQFWQIDAAAGHGQTGTLTTAELDSTIEGCVWHRIALDADIPIGTTIEVVPHVYATGGDTVPDLIPAPIVLSGDTPDCLVQGQAGQYLKLYLTFNGNGVATPVLRSIKIWFPRQDWLKYLPAIYQQDEESRSFLSRFLSILQTDFDGFDETIDNIWTLFDPSSVPNAWFLWLAAWIALPINPTWTDAQKRSVLKNAGGQYRLRGTPAGIQQLISDYAGVSARLFEHFNLRELIFLRDDPAKATPTGGGRLWSRDFYLRLQLGVFSRVGYFKLVGEPQPAAEAISWGAHEFTVFFDAEPLTVGAKQTAVAAVVEREKPAHTLAHYSPVYPRFRVGVQATLGLDSRIGTPGEAVLCQVSTLNYDAVLGASPVEREMRKFSAAVRPRIGVTTRLN